jgi:uncharacterized protein
MVNYAMFHRLGNIDMIDVYLEKYSGSLICLNRQESQYLTRDCDRIVTVSEKVKSFLEKSRLEGKYFPTASRKDSRKGAGIELTLMVTDCCNFACAYCFADSLYSGSTILEPENIFNYISEFINLSHANVSSLIFFGGEPLLAYSAIKKAWTKIQTLFDTHQGNMPSCAIVTNGSLITLDVAKFLAENDFAVTVSLDGPKIIHDLCRPLKGERGSYEQVIEGIHQLTRADAFYAIEVTYTSRHLALGYDVIDIVDHALGLNAQEIHVMPAFPEQTSGIDPSENKHVASLFKAAAARATVRYLTSGINELAYASRLSYAFAHDLRRHYVCTAGIDKFTIMTNGNIVPCYLVCDSPHVIASCNGSTHPETSLLLTKRAATTYQSAARVYLPECSQCWATDWCFACYGPGYAREGHLGAPGGLECEIYQAMTEATLLECARFLYEHQSKSNV